MLQETGPGVCPFSSRRPLSPRRVSGGTGSPWPAANSHVYPWPGSLLSPELAGQLTMKPTFVQAAGDPLAGPVLSTATSVCITASSYNHITLPLALH